MDTKSMFREMAEMNAAQAQVVGRDHDGEPTDAIILTRGAAQTAMTLKALKELERRIEMMTEAEYEKAVAVAIEEATEEPESNGDRIAREMEDE